MRAILLAGFAQVEMDVEPDTNIDAGLVCFAVSSLADLEMSTMVCSCASVVPSENMESGATIIRHVVSWSDIQEASGEDKEIKELLNTVKEGFTSNARTWSPTLHPYFPYSHAIYELDGVAMLGERIIIPCLLRPTIPHLLHAAHQGVDRMKARAGDSVSGLT